jgi:hypothetical protein
VGGAVATVCAAVAVFVTVGLAVTAGAFAIGLLGAVGVDDEEPAATAMPMMNRSPQNASNAVSTLCLAGQGFRPRGPPGGPYSTCVGGSGGG